MDSKKSKPAASFDMIFPTREEFHESCMAQTFSLPKSILVYIWSNPTSPEMYLKLIKCCKLFFLENPILVFKNLDYHYLTGWKYCDANECWGFSCGRAIEHKKLNMDEVEGKIWVTNIFCVGTNQKSTVGADLIPKMYRNDIKVLRLYNQILSYGELKYFATGVEECLLCSNFIKYDNGEEVLLDEVIKLFSGAKNVTLNFKFEIIACKSYADLVVACNTVEEVDFNNVPADFDVRKFYQQMKRCKSRALISIDSRSNSSVFNAVMDQITDEILGTESFDFTPPALKYYGQDEAKIKKMEKIQTRQAAKYL